MLPPPPPPAPPRMAPRAGPINDVSPAPPPPPLPPTEGFLSMFGLDDPPDPPRMDPRAGARTGSKAAAADPEPLLPVAADSNVGASPIIRLVKSDPGTQKEVTF